MPTLRVDFEGHRNGWTMTTRDFPACYVVCCGACHVPQILLRVASQSGMDQPQKKKAPNWRQQSWNSFQAKSGVGKPLVLSSGDDPTILAQSTWANPNIHGCRAQEQVSAHLENYKQAYANKLGHLHGEICVYFPKNVRDQNQRAFWDHSCVFLPASCFVNSTIPLTSKSTSGKRNRQKPMGSQASKQKQADKVSLVKCLSAVERFMHEYFVSKAFTLRNLFEGVGRERKGRDHLDSGEPDAMVNTIHYCKPREPKMILSSPRKSCLLRTPELQSSEVNNNPGPQSFRYGSRFCRLPIGCCTPQNKYL